jgi:HK97 family phage portal protein
VSLLGAALRSLESPSKSLTDPSVVEYFGGQQSTAGVAVTERSVYGLTAWYRAVAMLAGTMAALPLKVYRKGTRELVTLNNIVTAPSKRYTPFEFWQTMYANALSWGNAYARKIRNGAGVVVELVPIHPAFVNVDDVPVSDAYPDGKRYWLRLRNSPNVLVLSSYEMLHLPYMSVDGLTGLSPLAIARNTLGIGIAAETTAGSLYKNGSRLQAVLKTDQELKKEQAEDRRTRFVQRTTGANNAGGIAVLDKGLEYKTIALSPADAQLLESRKFTVTEIARMFGIPPHLLGDVEKSSSWGTGIEQQMIGFVTFTLLPWLRLVEQRLTLDVLPGEWTRGVWFAEYSVDGLLRGDSAAQASFFHQAITDGWMSRNEVRIIRNLEPIDGLEEYLAPSNLTLISVDGQLVPLSAKGTADAADTSAA